MDWNEWLNSLAPERRSEAESLRNWFTEHGANNPEEWTVSEIDEGIPQKARFAFLQPLWKQTIDRWASTIEDAPDEYPVVERLLGEGASSYELVRFARLVAYETTFALLARLAGHPADDENYEFPLWSLVAVDDEGLPTSSLVEALHEDLLTMDPSGEEGEDLWQ